MSWQNNTLLADGQWVSSKIQMARGLNGARKFISDPKSLGRFSIDLSAWHGYQEIFLKEAIKPKSVDFEFWLGQEAYIYVVNADQKSKWTLRWSSKEAIESAFFKVQSPGRFVSKERFEKSVVIPSQWHKARIQYDEESVAAYLNGKKVFEKKKELSEKIRLGFRGGLYKALVRNIQVRGKEQKLSKFSGLRLRLKHLLFASIFVFSFSFLCLSFIKKRMSAKEIVFSLVTLNFVVFTLSAGIFLTQYFFLSEKYLMVFHDVPNEERWQKAQIDEVNNELFSRYGAPKGKASFRIGFLGASQTWGAGAKNREDTLVQQVEKQLRNDWQRNGQVDCLQMAVPSLNSSQLVNDLYLKKWIDLDLDILVVNLAYNDVDIVLFEKNLRRLVKANKERNIKTIFSLEPVSFEGPQLDYIDRQHQLMRQIAREEQVEVIDLHGALLKQKDLGWLWWDQVHLTSFGQKLAAETIVDFFKTEPWFKQAQ